MKSQLFVIPFLFFGVSPFLGFAESGCLVPGYPELLLNQSGITGPYFNSPHIYPPADCWWSLVKHESGCIGHGRAGVKGEFEMQCPVDGSVYILIIFTIYFSLSKLVNQTFMPPVKISLITAVYNGQKYLGDCMRSVRAQTYPNIEYIVIDGGSTDGSLATVAENRDLITYFVSEKDRGMYDAINKGIAVATGDVVGILNADDVFASADVLEKVAAKFEEDDVEGVYGDLNYVSPDLNTVIRKWRSKDFRPKDLANGWMPAHPTLYLRKIVIERFGGYSLRFGTAADYEMMLRLLYTSQIRAVHLHLLMVNMRIGGMSNATFKQRFKAFVNDYRAIKANGIPFAIRTLLFKKLSKLPQFFA